MTYRLYIPKTSKAETAHFILYMQAVDYVVEHWDQRKKMRIVDDNPRADRTIDVMEDAGKRRAALAIVERNKRDVQVPVVVQE